jgi:peptidoglycan/xylan/chitin deacetylase (PgdA/CDA1 family)
VRAIQYLVAGRIGGRNDWDLPKEDVPERLMDLGQTREWIAAGHDIGSHTITHRDLKGSSLPEAREAIAASLDDAITQARQLARGLYPVRLETDGLVMALHELVANAGNRSGVSCSLAAPDELRLPDDATAIHLCKRSASSSPARAVTSPSKKPPARSCKPSGRCWRAGCI